MPLGVDHKMDRIYLIRESYVRKPLMPLGVDHLFDPSQTATAKGAKTFDAIRR